MKISKKEAKKLASSIRYSEEGLVPVAVISAKSKGMLMLGYANAKAIARTLETGYAWFYSRSRKGLWKKGEESGNIMEVAGVYLDCDSDAVCYEVDVKGNGLACHLGKEGCFELKAGGKRFDLSELAEIIESRAAKPNVKSYTSKLLSENKLAVAKVKEEALELAEAIGSKGKKEVVWEACDLIYHTLVAARARGVRLADIESELARRNKMR